VISDGTVCSLVSQVAVRVDSSHRPWWTSASAICNTTPSPFNGEQVVCTVCVCYLRPSLFFATTTPRTTLAATPASQPTTDVTPANRPKSMKPRRRGACKKCCKERNGGVCASGGWKFYWKQRIVDSPNFGVLGWWERAGNYIGFGNPVACSSECPHLPSNYDGCRGLILYNERFVDP